MHYDPVKASKIINACVVLHNICIENNVTQPEDDVIIADDEELGIINHINDEQMRTVNPHLVAGRELQRRLIQQYFTI